MGVNQLSTRQQSPQVGQALAQHVRRLQSDPPEPHLPPSSKSDSEACAYAHTHPSAFCSCGFNVSFKWQALSRRQASVGQAGLCQVLMAGCGPLSGVLAVGQHGNGQQVWGKEANSQCPFPDDSEDVRDHSVRLPGPRARPRVRGGG